ncbi:MAG: hypothetical protein R3250_08385, partial [Melioribacteraceae bacterium]|nr:hypothetical protein [Melioribacteraceae bacterium]
MLIKYFSLFLVFGLGSAIAQPTSSNQRLNNNQQSLDEVKILAVMVEFQEDDFELTYGDGTFGSIYSQDYGNDILDPLPHDRNYFEDHLEFAANYYSKVSNGKVSITYTVLPNVYTVSKTMREYSPLEGESFKVLGDFSQEVWEIVDNSNTSINFSDYNTFIIFHAGVGKDISTSDLFGEARDLPSISLNLNSLKQFYGNSFSGFQVGNNYFITNTLILPETESREETNVIGTTLLELSINGLIVSSIASRIGLPDLFDAETGKSAIGRFGLMDGQSLFAFAGVFPPEPSAWEKIYLGWEEPVVISEDLENLKVIAGSSTEQTGNKIYKIPINSSEYFLIENRNRDVGNDGITITYKVAGEVRKIKFNEDLDNFNNAFVDTLKGVILDVDEYDWAVPGNGILIWHIDERIISEGIEQNRVNVGESRGVDLEEADGIQDIGEEFQTIFGDIIIAEGDEFDLWYSDNSSELFNNSFGINTKPNSNSNSGANSLITIDNFSSVANEMTFNVTLGSPNISSKGIVQADPNIQISNIKVIP